VKLNYWKATTIILGCCLLLGLGYELNSWLKPTNVKAQGEETTTTPGRFQLMSFEKDAGVGYDRWLLDTATGRVFWLGSTQEYGDATKEIPIKSCADADCTKRIGTKDAR
jgi:hypothetical protein